MAQGNSTLWLEIPVMLLLGAISIFILFSMIKNRKVIFDVNLFKEKLKIHQYKFYINSLVDKDFYQNRDFLLMNNNDMCSLESTIDINHDFKEHHIYVKTSDLFF